MKSRCAAVVVAFLCASVSIAADKPTAATIISMQAVECGTKNKGKKSSTAVLCHQYIVRTSSTEYQIRQPKPSEEAILPPNTSIQFTVDKQKMKFKANGKKYEYLVVGMTALPSQ
jgi:hypothetical protein